MGDFIKDESGTYWLTGVKAYILEHVPEVAQLKRITNAGDNYIDPDLTGEPKKRMLKEEEYRKLSKCKYCEEIMKESTHKMTIKMIM